MKTTAFVIFTSSLVLILGLSSCGRPQQQAPPASSPAAAQFTPTVETGPFVVIGHMEHRDRIVTIKSGSAGTVYSARNKEGKILFENLTAEQLKEQSPEIHDFIRSAEAGSADLMLLRKGESRLLDANR
jgi:hypothetical protein